MTSTVKTILLLVVAIILLTMGLKVLVWAVAWTVKLAFWALILLVVMALLARVLKRA